MIPLVPGQIVKDAWANPWVRYVIILLVGITIGAVFYPSKNVKESVSKHYEEQIQTLNEQHKQELQQTSKVYDQTISDMKSKQVESNEAIQKLTTQVTQLQSHTKTTHFKIVHPDGTVEERDSSEADTDQSSNISTEVQAEFQQKLQEQQSQLNASHQQEITTLQTQFDQKEASYKLQIEDLQKTKSVETNPKKFGVEAGMLNDRGYYGHVSYDVWGPFFLGLHSEFEPSDSRFGAGVGFRF